MVTSKIDDEIDDDRPGRNLDQELLGSLPPLLIFARSLPKANFDDEIDDESKKCVNRAPLKPLK